MLVTTTKSNTASDFKGTRIRVWAVRPDGVGRELMGTVIVNSRDGVRYCREHPSGAYGRLYFYLVAMAREREQAMQQDEQQRQEWESNEAESCRFPEFLLCDNCPVVMDCHSSARVCKAVR